MEGILAKRIAGLFVTHQKDACVDLGWLGGMGRELCRAIMRKVFPDSRLDEAYYGARSLYADILPLVTTGNKNYLGASSGSSPQQYKSRQRVIRHV
jgi:hypothetical protein